MKTMKTIKKKKEESAIQQLRSIRDKIGLEIQDMTFEQLKKYVEERLTLHPRRAWQKRTDSAMRLIHH